MASSVLYDGTRQNIDRQAGQSLLRKSSGASLSVASRERNTSPLQSKPINNLSFDHPQSPNSQIQNGNYNNNNNNNYNQSIFNNNNNNNNNQSNYNNNNQYNNGSNPNMDGASNYANNRGQGSNSDQKALTLLGNGSRAKKVYIYTGVDPSVPSMVPISAITPNKNSSVNGEAQQNSPRPSAVVGKSSSKGILKTQRKPESMNPYDDSAAILSNDGNNYPLIGQQMQRDQSPSARSNTGSVAGPRSVTPNRYNYSPNSIVRPDNNRPNQFEPHSVGAAVPSTPTSSSINRIPPRTYEGSASPISRSQVQPQVQREPAGLGIDPREENNGASLSQQKTPIGVASARKRPVVQSILQPLKEEETEERDDRSQGKRTNSAMDSVRGGQQQQPQQKYNANNQSQPVILVNDKIPFNIGGVSPSAGGLKAAPTGNSESNSSPKSKSIFYSIDEGGLATPGGTMLSNSTNTSDGTGGATADSNKFVHTQSYLKRRMQNIERQNRTEMLNLQNDEIQIRNQVMPPKTEAFPVSSQQQRDYGMNPSSQQQSQKFSSPKLTQLAKLPQALPQQSQQVYQQQQYLPPQPPQVSSSQQKKPNPAPAKFISSYKPDYWLSDEDELNFSEDNSYHDQVKPFSPNANGSSNRKFGLNPLNNSSNGNIQFLDSESDYELPMQEKPMYTRVPSSQNQRTQKKAWVPNSYYPVKKDVKKRGSGREYSSSNNNIPMLNEKIIPQDSGIYQPQQQQQQQQQPSYQRVNPQRAQNQGRALDLLDEQDRMIEKIIQKYKSRAQFEEEQIKQKLTQLEKDRDSLARLKQQEQKLTKMKVNLHQNIDSISGSDSSFYYNNQDVGQGMPMRTPNYRYPPTVHAASNLRDLEYLDSIMGTQSNSPVKNRNHPSNSLHGLQEQHQQRNRSFSLAQPY